MAIAEQQEANPLTEGLEPLRNQFGGHAVERASKA